MIFALLRLLPLILPVFYFTSIRLLFVFDQYWLWHLAFIFLINSLFFLILWLKKKDKKIFIFSFYPLIFAMLGFFEVWILSDQIFILIFSIVWALAYGVFLEAIFHHFYQTKKTILFDLKNMTAIFNVVVFFFLSNLLFYFNIFNDLSWRLVLPLYGLIGWLILFCFFSVRELNFKNATAYASIIALALVELMAAMLFWSASLFVSSFILTALAYLLTSISVLILNRQVKPNLIISYVFFTLLVIIAVLFTTQWI